MPPPAPADFDTAVLEGFAQLLEDAGAGTWEPTGAYAAAVTGIILSTLPQSPDRVIVLASYGVTDDPSLSDSVVGLQVTTRWGGQDPRPTGVLAARVFDALHGLHGVDLSTGVHVTQCLRQSWTPLGTDANSRHRTSQNFYVTVHRPSLHRT